MINFITRPFTRKKLGLLRTEREWLAQAATRARKANAAVSHIQYRLTEVAHEFMRLEAKL